MEQQAVFLPTSEMAEGLVGSEIIKLAGEINTKIRNGETIYNFTIGDFDPKIFPIPAELKSAILNAYQNDHTNYPAGDGMLELRNAVSSYIQRYQGLSYANNEILIAGGARPIIYTIYKVLLDSGDGVIYPTPSWNNNHYCHLMGAKQFCIETTAENNFMPTAAEIAPYVKDAHLLALCSPLNPTGTTFTKEALSEICKLVLEENKRRGADKKPLYVMYDQIYSLLTFDGITHVDPVSLYPEMRNYTIFVDGISKAFAATGVRVGWTFGPERIVGKMKSVLGHIGAWAPKAEQVATAEYMVQNTAIDSFIVDFKHEIKARLQGFYEGMQVLKQAGHAVDAIPPQAAIYLTIKLDLVGKTTASGQVLNAIEDVAAYVLNEAKVAIVPFYAFGSPRTSPWFRLSVGTTTQQDVEDAISSLRRALENLN
jgi:aspartate aminotransferase